MADTRLNSMHLALQPRRRDYRRARENLFSARGWLTLASERVQGWIPEDADWVSVLPERLPFLPVARYVLHDLLTGQSHPTRIGVNTLGRSPGNDVVLEGSRVSRRHCVILVHAGRAAELHDTASLNGTRLNGRRVRQPCVLTSGDVIEVCKRSLLFVTVEDHEAVVDDARQPVTVPE